LRGLPLVAGWRSGPWAPAFCDPGAFAAPAVPISKPQNRFFSNLR
jgi:hypothetical protein